MIMPTKYRYELWNGKEVVGCYVSINNLLLGDHLIIPDGFEGKQIKIPIIYRMTYQDHQDTHLRVCLDVSKKSKRQIEIIKSSSNL